MIISRKRLLVLGITYLLYFTSYVVYTFIFTLLLLDGAIVSESEERRSVVMDSFVSGHNATVLC